MMLIRRGRHDWQLGHAVRGVAVKAAEKHCGKQRAEDGPKNSERRNESDEAREPFAHPPKEQTERNLGMPNKPAGVRRQKLCVGGSHVLGSEVRIHAAGFTCRRRTVEAQTESEDWQ